MDERRVITDDEFGFDEAIISTQLAQDAKSKAEDVLLDVAGNEHADLETLKNLAKNKSWKVRAVVAANPKLDWETLKTLANDENSCVSTEAILNPGYRDLSKFLQKTTRRTK